MAITGPSSANRLTIAVFLVAAGVLVMLAGGPSQFLFTIEHSLEGFVTTIVQMYQGTRA